MQVVTKNRCQHTSPGFTLIEILVAMGILTTMVSLTLVSMNVKASFQKANDTKRKSDISMLHKAFVQYFVDHRCYPTLAQWEALSCGGNVPDEFKDYMSEVPCDPTTGEKYGYEPLDNQCKQCNGGCGVCVGLRILTHLEKEKDYTGSAAGCNPYLGCGKSDALGNLYNYGVATAGNNCRLPTPSPTDILTPSPSPSPAPTATNTPTATQTLAPSPIPTATPTPTPAICPAPSPSSVFTCSSYQIASVWGTKVQNGGSYYYIAGSGNGQFNYPVGIDSDSMGNIYVSDSSNYRVQKLDTNGNFITKWGSHGNGPGQFNRSWAISVSCTDKVFVSDENYPLNSINRIEQFTNSGSFVTQWGSYGTATGQFKRPFYNAVDRYGNVYVSDILNYRIQKFDSNGTFLTSWGSYGSGTGQFINPRGIAIHNNGNVYVADSGNHRIQVFSSSGTYLSKFGSMCETGINLHLGTCDNKFFWPDDVAIDPNGNIYVLDGENNRVQKFDTNWNFITRWGQYGSLDGQFKSPSTITVDPSGNIYVADYNQHRIEKFTCAN